MRARLDEAFRLAVGPRRIGSGALVLDPQASQQIAERVALVGGAVVGHHPLDLCPMTIEPGDGPGGEPDRAFLAFVRQDLGVGQARGVIDGDVDKLPAGAALVAPSAAIAADTVADAVGTAELLDIDMDEFARASR